VRQIEREVFNRGRIRGKIEWRQFEEEALRGVIR
jgi:hypothetical protein